MVTPVKCDIFPEPGGRTERIGTCFVREFDFGKKQAFAGFIKYIQFDGKTILHRDQITSLGDQFAVDFFFQMGITFCTERQVVFFPCHQAAGFVGEDIVVVLTADADDRFAAEIALLDQNTAAGFKIRRKIFFIDQIFSFNFHKSVPPEKRISQKTKKCKYK